MTTVGVACRGKIPLENVAVELQFEAFSGGEQRCGVREKVTFRGAIDRQQQQRLERTIDYCPVGQFLGRGIVTIEDRIDHQASSSDVSLSRPLSFSQATMCALVSGTVNAQYLPETKVWKSDSVERILEHEGEVKLYFTCRTKNDLRRWVMLSGHTLSWNPIPMHLALGGLAASTVATLRQILAPAPLNAEDLKVEVEIERGSSSGGRQTAQAAAAEGIVRKYHVMRRITVGGRLRGASADSIHAALQQDPVSRYYRDGNILAAKEVVVIA